MTTLLIKTDAPIVNGPPQGLWTYADWEALPDDGNRYEIVHGVLYTTTAPHSFHQWIIRRLERYIGIPSEDQGLAFSFPAPIGLIMAGADPVQPDYVVVLQEHADILRDGRIYGVPDLIIEVLSPGTRAYDERVKLAAYAAAGVPEYAIVDPANRSLSLYRLDDRSRYLSPQIAQADAQVSFACLPTITLRVSDLFAGAPDTSL